MLRKLAYIRQFIAIPNNNEKKPGEVFKNVFDAKVPEISKTQQYE